MSFNLLNRPQLVLNCMYIDIMGFGQADGISVFSILMTLFGIFCNIGIVFFEYVCACD